MLSNTNFWTVPTTTEYVYEIGSPMPQSFQVPVMLQSPSPGSNVVAITCEYCGGSHYYARKPGRISCHGCGAKLSCI